MLESYVYGTLVWKRKDLEHVGGKRERERDVNNNKVKKRRERARGLKKGEDPIIEKNVNIYIHGPFLQGNLTNSPTYIHIHIYIPRAKSK